jgi:hypothetical protein
MAAPAFVGAFVWLFVGILLSRFVFQQADAGLFPGLVAGIWAAWAVFQYTHVRKDSLLHVPPLAAYFPAPPWWLLGVTALALLSLGASTARSVSQTAEDIIYNRAMLKADTKDRFEQYKRIDAELVEWRKFKELHHL